MAEESREQRRSMLACVKEVGGMPFVLFEYYLTCAPDEADGSIRPTLAQIAEDLGLTKPAVCNLRAKLACAGWIRIENDRVFILKSFTKSENHSQKMNENPAHIRNIKDRHRHYSSQEKNGGGGGITRTPAHAREPTATAVTVSAQNRQWIELTPDERAMSQAEFAEHLQKLYPTKQVREVGKKLKRWCADNGKAFCRERLKGWMHGEHEPLDDEFLRCIGADDESPPKETPEEKQARLAKHFQSVPSTLKKKTKPEKIDDV